MRCMPRLQTQRYLAVFAGGRLTVVHPPQCRVLAGLGAFVEAQGCNKSLAEYQERVSGSVRSLAKVKNREGEFQYFYGSEEKRAPGQPRAFFLEPYAEIVKLCWSKGRRRETRNLFIERFDCRAQFMSFEFNCRTSDNVELILEGTFFWEVVDLPAMVKSTGDSRSKLVWCLLRLFKSQRLPSQV